MNTGLLILGGAVLVALVLPKYGVISRLRAGVNTRCRRREEDALKYLLERRNEGLATAGATLAGLLRISSTARIRLQSRLEEQELTRTEGDELVLTAKGEELALHILRAHRLWEHYLATEAQMPLEKIHHAAHRLEHSSDAEQLGIMEARLGYPQADPHGDPIPARDGSLADATRPVPLVSWGEGIPAVVVHLEDEPEIAFRQMLAEGISLGQRIRILESTSSRITLTDGEREFRLAPAIAANVYVAEPPSSRQAEGIGLNVVADAEEAEVVGIDDACQGLTRRRLLDLGLIPGTRVSPELSNSFGDPRAYRIRGTLIALRKEQAAHVIVRRVESQDPVAALESTRS
jgi:DtxR family Mn-dependent transcriptional regulator